MPTVHEARLRRGNWIIQYDLGAIALTASFGSNSRHYRQVVSLLQTAGFVRIQHSIFRHRSGCVLQHAINVVVLIRQLPWAGGTSPNGAPHIRSIRLSIQVMQYMDLTNYVRGGRLPNIPRF
ncbi:5191_t:CDS:1 [Gigaspora rosea]|nr:5191_t:CDS:1 [Gigaspora rosea]